MSESTARADRFGAPASSSPAYLWEVANKPVSVRLNLEMVERLEREVVESFRSLSSRGSEIGGLLLGSVQSGTPARVWVESYELVACDYARGPLYQLSEADVERFKQAAAQRNAGNLRVVGFFRSHTRKGLGLDGDDTSFLAGHFRDPQQIALLIRPYASKPSTAGIFMWENGAIHSEASYQEFPFRRSELERVVQTESRTPAPKPAAGPDPVSAPAETSQAKPATRAQIVPIASRREITMPPPPPPERPVARTEYAAEPAPPRPPVERPAPAAPPPAPREPEVPAFARSAESRAANPAAYEEPSAGSSMELSDLVLPPLERPRRGKMVWITAGCAAGLLVVSGALIYPGFGHKGKTAATAALPALSLHVERQANELLLKWDPNSDLVKNAEHAVLAISDGDQHENVNLDLNQLRAGSVEYLPSGSDVSFQLSVVGLNSKETHSESVRVLKTHTATPDDTPAPQQAKATPAPQPAKATPEPSRPAPAASAPATPAPAPQQPVQVADNRPKSQTREFHPESLAERLRPVRSADLPEAPGITAAAPVAVNLPGLNTTTPLVAPPLPSRPAASAATPGAALKTGGRVQQAQIISSVPPEYPLVAKQNHVSGVVVVSAMIGVDGRVKSATAISGPALLQRAAVDAVRHWIYRPTTLDGAPTESETRVEVKFSNGR